MSHVKIYTKTGDAGTSSLFNGERRSKDDLVFEVLGTVDELNAHVGLSYEQIMASSISSSLEKTTSMLSTIQSSLLDLGSHVATPMNSEASDEKHLQRAAFNSEYLLKLVEESIDEMDAQLPPLRNFILPSGGLSSAQLHVTRAVCRRAERLSVQLLTKGDIDTGAYKYLNRLSDWLFVAARFCAMKEGKSEVIYKKAKSSSSSMSSI